MQLFSFFDCCREKIATKSTKTNAESTENHGQSATFYAKEDGGLAAAGSRDDALSPTTKAVVYFLEANPGAKYPQVLQHFQFAVMNRCDIKLNTTRGLIIVKHHPRTWKNEEMLKGFNKKVETLFPKKHMENVYNAANEAFSSGKLLKQFRDVSLLLKEEKKLSPVESEIEKIRSIGEIG